jgi:predicted MarR family transcription regulator
MISVLYILIVFLSPEFADKYWNTKLNLFIRDFKHTIDNIYTKNNINDVYNRTLSWAEDLKNNLIEGANSAKGWVDEVRKNLNWVVDKYEDVKGVVNEKKEQLQEWIDKVKEVSDSINNTFSGILQDSWTPKESTWSLQED